MHSSDSGHFNGGRLPVCGALVLAGLSLLGTMAAAATNLPEIIDKVRPSIVAIGSVEPTRRPPVRMTATGFVVGGGRHVVTNAHAIPKELNIENKEVLAVFTGDRQQPRKLQVRQASVVRIDPDHDLALIRIQGAPLPALTFADSERIREGDAIAFTGYPIIGVLGKYPVTHTGIISAITPIVIPQLSARSLSPKVIKRLRNPYRIFQLDATAYPGNSGSPVYNRKTGEVVAIINKVFVKGTKENVLSKPSGISYAIPSRYAVDLLQEAGVLN